MFICKGSEEGIIDSLGVADHQVRICQPWISVDKPLSDTSVENSVSQNCNHSVGVRERSMSKDHIPQTTSLELREVGKREFRRRVDVLDVEDGDGWRHIDRHDGSKLRVSRVNRWIMGMRVSNRGSRCDLAR